MKQLFYIVGFVVLMIVAWKVMAKVKDVPEQDFRESDDIDEIEEAEESEEETEEIKHIE